MCTHAHTHARTDTHRHTNTQTHKYTYTLQTHHFAHTPQGTRLQRNGNKHLTRTFNLFRAVDELQRRSMQRDRNKEFSLEGGLMATSLTKISQIDAEEWNTLVNAQEEFNPFVSHVSG